MSRTLFVPTLNEIVGMKAVMPLVESSWVDQILVVDGGSQDGTIEYAKECGYDVFVQQRKGLRHAFTEGFPLITGDHVVTFSPDGNSVPEAIPQVFDALEAGQDMVIASRYLGDATSQDDSLITRFGNWSFTQAINVLFGGSYTDSFVMFRGYRTKLFYELDLHLDEFYARPERLFFTTVGIEPLLSIRCAKRNCKVTEIPADEPARIGGEAKLQVIRWGCAYLYQVLSETMVWR